MKYLVAPVALTAVLGLVAACDGETENQDATGGSSTTTNPTSTGGGGAGGEAGAGGSGGDGGGGVGGDGGAGGSSSNSAGCKSGSGLTEGEHTFMLENLERKYMVRLPNNYDPAKAWPLVLALHGNGGSLSSWDSTSGSNNIRGELDEDAVLIIAEAIDGQWRDYNMDSSTWPARIETELAYFEQVINDATSELCIDEDEIFSMGFSGGGSFSGVLGCRRTDIRAIAVGGSVIYFDEANCVNSPAAWITIGQGELSSGREAYRDFFRDGASCMSSTMATEPSPCVAYDGCDAATPVHYCEHPDGHIWPDFASAAMWQFFATFVD